MFGRFFGLFELFKLMERIDALFEDWLALWLPEDI